MNDSPHGTGLELLDYLAVVAYLAATAWIGYRATKKQDDTEDYFLGGRSMPWFAVGLSIMATLMSTNTYVGAPGEMIKYGPAYFFGYAALPFVAWVVLGFWVPFFMRLRMTSAYDYLEKRFDPRARRLGTLLFLGLRFGWIAVVVYTASKAMVTMLPEPAAWAVRTFGVSHAIFPTVTAVGIAATIYACIGGIRAVIWTDVLQSIMLFGGVAMIVGYVMVVDGTGVGTWWQTATTAAHTPAEVKWFTLDIAERTTVAWGFFSVFFWQICTHCSDQVALQRYFTTTSLPAARKSFIVNILSSLTIGLLLGVSGLALRHFYEKHAGRLPAGLSTSSNAEQLMPHFFVYELPMGFGGLILVSFLCDAMQTLGSGVNSIASTIAGRSPEEDAKSDGEGVWFARLTTLVIGAIVTALAVLASWYALTKNATIFDIMPKMFNMFLGPLGAMFMIGMFYRRVTGSVVLWVILITQAFSTLWSWWAEVPELLRTLYLSGAADWWTSILGVNDLGHPRSPSVFLAIGMPALFGLALGWVAGLLFGRDKHPGVEYTRREVMKLPAPEATV